MKKFFYAFLFIGIAVVVWYLFIKEYDYQFRFNAKYGPASVYKEILQWENFDEKDSLFHIKLLRKKPFTEILQEVKLQGNKNLRLQWELEYKNDSVTRVLVNTLASGHSLSNRLQILNPFAESTYVSRLKPKLGRLLQDLSKRQDSYSITFKDTLTSPSVYCAYIKTKSTAEGKARAMTSYVGELEDYLQQNHLKLKGHPMVKITHWDLQTDSIYFDFCFPIEYKKGLPETGDVKLKEIKASKSLLAVFHGNYGLTHLAWYDL
ncbi:MAG: hypothetical protein WCD31_12160, partial [Gillisia sp.]